MDALSSAKSLIIPDTSFLYITHSGSFSPEEDDPLCVEGIYFTDKVK